MSSYSRQQLENWLKTIEVKGGKVLDCGGSQNPLSSDRFSVFEPEEYKILDLEQPHECKQKPDFICDIQEHSDRYEFYNNENNKFDIIFCLEVSEYWYNPFEALDNIHFLLKNEGILYISFHFVYPVHKPSGKDYLRYTEHGARKLLEETGFKILEMKPRLFMDKHKGLKNDSFVNWCCRESMKPAKYYNKHKWQGCLIQAKKC